MPTRLERDVARSVRVPRRRRLAHADHGARRDSPSGCSTACSPTRAAPTCENWQLRTAGHRGGAVRPAGGRGQVHTASTASGCWSSPAIPTSRGEPPRPFSTWYVLADSPLGPFDIARRAAVRGTNRSCSPRRSSSVATAAGRSWASSTRSPRDSELRDRRPDPGRAQGTNTATVRAGTVNVAAGVGSTPARPAPDAGDGRRGHRLRRRVGVALKTTTISPASTITITPGPPGSKRTWRRIASASPSRKSGDE